DHSPPALERCLEFSDTLWYFLRATDHILVTGKTAPVFTPPDADPWDSIYWLSFDIAYVPEFSCKFYGWLPEQMVSFTLKDGFIEADCSKLVRWDDPDHDYAELHPDKDSEAITISAIPILTDAQRESLVKSALRSA
ncbi:MAG: hypothetical protein AAGF67_16350, partial [Verrucomicrobiota bacterium]